MMMNPFKHLIPAFGLAIQLSACLIGSAQAQPTAAPRTFGDMVGLNTKYTQGEPQKDLPLLTGTLDSANRIL